jgi:hypothetical protein
VGLPLSMLGGRFVRLHGIEGGYQVEPTIESADGILFVCPLCHLAARDEHYDPNVGVRGVHSVLCWRPRVPAGIEPGPGRWEFQGSGIRDVTLVAGSSSIKLLVGCEWHGYVRNGECVDDLGLESVERARNYHRSWKQRIIDQETKMTGTNTYTCASGAEPAKPFVELFEGAPPGYGKTNDIKYFGTMLAQRWVSGHDPNLPGVWVKVPTEQLPKPEVVGTETRTYTRT